MIQSEEIFSISQFKNNTAKIVEEISLSGKSVIITQNGQAKVVVIDMKQYERWQKTMLLLKFIAQSEIDIKSDKVIENEDVFKNIQNKLKETDSTTK